MIETMRSVEKTIRTIVLGKTGIHVESCRVSPAFWADTLEQARVTLAWIHKRINLGLYTGSDYLGGKLTGYSEVYATYRARVSARYPKVKLPN